MEREDKEVLLEYDLWCDGFHTFDIPLVTFLRHTHLYYIGLYLQNTIDLLVHDVVLVRVTN